MSIIKPINQQYEDYLYDELRIKGWAESISFPKNESEIIEVVKECNKTFTAITVQGGRTGIASGVVPEGGHIMNVSKMNKIISARYDDVEDSFYLTIQPGLLLCQLRQYLLTGDLEIRNSDQVSMEAMKHLKPGEWSFPPDPTEPTATIGGMVSCNASGARSYFYGATRKHINSLRMVIKDGSILTVRKEQYKAQGKNFVLIDEDGGEIKGVLPSYNIPNVKDASSYYVKENMDMLQLFIGAQGTLGIISEIEIKLMRSPSHILGIVAFLPDMNTALAYIKALKNQANQDMPYMFKGPVAIEYFDYRALALLREYQDIYPVFDQVLKIKPDYRIAIYSEFHFQQEDERQEVAENLIKLLESIGCDPAHTWVANNPEDIDKLLHFRHSFPEAGALLQKKSQDKDSDLVMIGTDMSVKDESLEEIIKFYYSNLEKTDLDWIVYGHIGDNHPHINFFPKSKDESLRAKELYIVFAKKVVELGGSLSAEHGIGKLKRDSLIIMWGEEIINEMRQLKKVFDPNGIMCPGNMFKI